MALTLAGTPAINGLSLPTDTFVPGMVLVNKTDFTTVSSISLNNVFTSAYENYRLVIKTVANSTNSFVLLRLRASGTDTTTSYYEGASGVTAANAARNIYTSNDTQFYLAETSSATPITNVDAMIQSPQLAAYTALTFTSVGNNNVAVITGWAGGGVHGSNSSVFDGFTLFQGSSGTFSGTVRVYGLRNQ